MDFRSITEPPEANKLGRGWAWSGSKCQRTGRSRPRRIR